MEITLATSQPATSTAAPPKRRARRGSGSIYQQGRVWWISYRGPDGLRHFESSHSERKGDARRLLERRIGAREHNLPIIKNAEQLTFSAAAQAVLDDFKANGKRSEAVVRRRIVKHLEPHFLGKRLASITPAHVTEYIVARQAQGIVAHRGPKKGQRIADVSNAEINRELAILKRIFSLAIKSGRLATKPHITMLRESAARAGFLDRAQVNAVRAHLPAELSDVVDFAFITGWRLHSEVLPLEWRNVDFAAGELRLDAGTTKNGEGRVFPMTAALRTLLVTRHTEHEALKKAGQIEPWVFWRMVAEGRGGKKTPQPIVSLGKAWKSACAAAGCPGRIPHDLRRSAVRSFVRAGLSEHVAMRLSGHLTPSVFRRYDIISSDDLRNAASSLDFAAGIAPADSKQAAG